MRFYTRRCSAHWRNKYLTRRVRLNVTQQLTSQRSTSYNRCFVGSSLECARTYYEMQQDTHT